MKDRPLPKRKKAEPFDFFYSPAQNQRRGVRRGRPRKYAENSFGGDRFQNSNPRSARPLSKKNAIHLVLKSKIAIGRLSLLHRANKSKVLEIIEKQARTNKIKLCKYANGGDHLHLLVRIADKPSYQKFIRAITGLIARWILKAEKGAPSQKGVRFWQGRPFTRIINPGKDLQWVHKFFAQKKSVAIGWIDKKYRLSKKSSELKILWAMSGGILWDST